MQRWSGLLKVPICPQSSNNTCYEVAVSLCFCPDSNTLIVPSENAIFFNGDSVKGTGNPIIEKLSDPQKIADILASKFPCTVNIWVKKAITRTEETFISMVPSTSNHRPKTILLGFSKGGTVVNQLVIELSCSEPRKSSQSVKEETQILPTTRESLLSSISDIHYVDVGLNAPGAYITDSCVVRRIGNHVAQRTSSAMRFYLHGTPRQWCDSRRDWIREEKDVMVSLLESESLRVESGKLKVCEKLYFADQSPNLQMHFQIIEELDLSVGS